MKSLAIWCATSLLRLIYLLCHHLIGVKDRFVCLSRQSDDEPIDFRLIRSFVEKNVPGYQVIIMAKKLSSPLTYIPHMLLQTVRIATSRAVLLDSYCIVVSLLGKTIKAPVVQLWHAMGNMKRFGYAALDEPEGRSSQTARLLHMHEGYDCVVISSKVFIDDYVAGFNVSPEIVFESPLPKADLLTDPRYRQRRREEIERRYPELSGKKNIVYCPTFRKPSTERDVLALERLADCVDFDRYNLIYKPHPVSTLRFGDPRVFQHYDHSYDMLYAADYVISDYSSVIYEAGLMGLPVLLYIYDWNSYRMRRGLNIDLSQDVPAPASADPDVLMRHIALNDFDLAAYAAFIRRYVVVPTDEGCTERIVRHVFDLISSSGTQGVASKSLAEVAD